jgi:hypothetical protein
MVWVVDLVYCFVCDPAMISVTAVTRRYYNSSSIGLSIVDVFIQVFCHRLWIHDLSRSDRYFAVRMCSALVWLVKQRLACFLFPSLLFVSAYFTALFFDCRHLEMQILILCREISLDAPNYTLLYRLPIAKGRNAKS